MPADRSLAVSPRTGTYWPTDLQREILAVAFAEPASAVRAWTALQPRFDLDELEPGVFVLLPLVYRNLTRSGLDGPILQRLKGIVRRSWVLNNMMLGDTVAVSRALADAGIPALFVEGPVFARRFYPELALRPSHSVDVLVDANAASDAVATLEPLGWRPDPTYHATRDDRRVLVDVDGRRCVVQTSISLDFTGRSGRRTAHAPLWEAAEVLEVEGTELRVPSPTDTLLAVCVANARVGSASGPQWVADAKFLLEQTLDWPRLASVAAGGGQSLRLATALAYLDEIEGPRPPSDALQELRRIHVSRRERLVYGCTAGRFRRLGNLTLLAAEHLSDRPDESLLRAAGSFPAHVRDRWGLSHTWQVPIAAGRRAVRRKAEHSAPSSV